MLPAKRDCTGCSACVAACPKKCISMEYGEDGFYTPRIDLRECIHCNQCEQVCEKAANKGPNAVREAFVCQNKNPELLNRSSSGGIFPLLAKKILEDNGVVYGVAFSEKKLCIYELKTDRN